LPTAAEDLARIAAKLDAPDLVIENAAATLLAIWERGRIRRSQQACFGVSEGNVGTAHADIHRSALGNRKRALEIGYEIGSNVPPQPMRFLSERAQR